MSSLRAVHIKDLSISKVKTYTENNLEKLYVLHCVMRFLFVFPALWIFLAILFEAFTTQDFQFLDIQNDFPR